MNIAKQFIETNGITFQIKRNGMVISSILGLPNHEKATSKAYIGVLDDTNIAVGDWLISPVNERFYIKDKISDFAFGELQQFKLFYLTESEYKQKSISQNNTTFNIGTAYGSVIGTQSSVNMNYQHSIQQLQNQVAESNSPDKEQLEKILSTLQLIVDGNIPAQKGILSKFSDVMERNSWITGAIASTLLSWLTAQIR